MVGYIIIFSLYKENKVLLVRDRLCKSDGLQQEICSKNMERYNNKSSDNDSIINERGYYLNDLPIMISGDEAHMSKIIALVIIEGVKRTHERGGNFQYPKIDKDTEETQEDIILIIIIESEREVNNFKAEGKY